MAQRTVVGMYDRYEDARGAVEELESSGIAHDHISILANDATRRLGRGGSTETAPGLGATTTTGARADVSMTDTTGNVAGLAPSVPGGPSDPLVRESGSDVYPTRDDLRRDGDVVRTAGGRTDDVDDADAKRDDSGRSAGTGATIGTVLGGGAGLLAGIGAMAIPGIGPIVAAGWLIATLTGAGVGAAAGGLIGGLVGGGVSEADAHVYAEGLRRGATLVSVRTDDADADRVMAVLQRHNAVNIQERGAQYRQTGWDRFDETAEPYTASEIERDRTAAQTMPRRDVI